MSKFVLKALPKIKDSASDGYYTGESYIEQGMKCAVVDKDIEKAETYPIYLEAVVAIRKLDFENYKFEPCRLDEETKILKEIKENVL